MRDCCAANQFSGCCEGRECQSFNAQVERRRSSRKSQRDAEATNAEDTVAAKYVGDSAFVMSLAFLFVAVLFTASFFLFSVPEGKRLGMVHQEQVAVR